MISYLPHIMRRIRPFIAASGGFRRFWPSRQAFADPDTQPSFIRAPFVSHHADAAPWRARFKGKPSAFRQAGPFRRWRNSASRSFPVAFAQASRPPIRAARESEGNDMSRQDHPAAKRQDIYSEITSQLIAAIEANPGTPALPWRKSSGPLFMPVNALTQNAYNGINIVSLWVAAEVKAYATPIWASYKQWLELGAQVRKDEKSSLVIFYKEFDANPDPDDASDDGKRRIARASRVFNAAQVDGYVSTHEPEKLGPVERIAAADSFVSATGARIEHGGDRAYYRPSSDHIQMPSEDAFCGSATMNRSEGYYATLVHELTHWSGASRRLDREFGKRFGDHAYAAEELVAEIGAAFLCAELQITQDVRPDHAQYLAQWLKLMKGDARAVFTAAAKASEAASYLKRLGAEARAAA
jgi:antirestriction protein ArdC